MASRRLRRIGGTPIEEAPLWVLSILFLLLWLIAFPALVGLANGVGLVRGGVATLAAAAAVVSFLLVLGLARLPRWRRKPALGGGKPLFARFSTWLVTALLVPNVLHGVLVLATGGEPFDYATTWLIGLLVSAIHALGALLHGLRGRRSAPNGPSGPQG
ncbi:MAG: hypothetical protein R3325_00090 [Thermoanaerobaculia bacterium]|nr:hypothetical protein [Thermoanaerobaculia bacterium]